MVINLDKSDEEGSHWVALYIKNRRTVNYFDSLGADPPFEIAKYLSRFEKLFRNTVCIQSDSSKVCGQYCIYFIYYASLDLTFANILKTLYIPNPDSFVRKFAIEFLK